MKNKNTSSMNAARAQREQMKAAKEKRTALLAWITAAVIILAVVAAIVISNAAGNKKPQPVINSGETVAAATDEIKINGQMMTFFLNGTYQSFIDYYGDNIEQAVGIDMSKDLREQYYDQETTWFEYIEDQTKSHVEELLVLCSAANKEGITLTEQERAAAAMSAAAYDAKSFGENVTTQDIAACMELSFQSQKYKNYLESKAPCTPQDIESYKNENKNMLMLCDYISYTIVIGDDKDKAQQTVDKFAACNNKEQFVSTIAEQLVAEQQMTESEAQSAAEQYITQKAAYSGSQADEWLFYSAKENEMLVQKDDENKHIYVYMLLKAPYLDESPTKNVRHILISGGINGTDEQTRQKAERILDEWSSGEKTAESFGVLAAAYSDDVGSCFNGGLYKGVQKGQTVEQFENWCFDSSRKPGDTGIVQSDYGCHVMYFDSQGDSAWQQEVKDTLIYASYNDKYAELKGSTSISYDENYIWSIELKG